MKNKLIELSKIDCEHCEAAKPIISKLRKEGITFEEYNVGSREGQGIWDLYLAEIEENSKKLGYARGFIYTPTFINPKTGKALAFAARPPTKDELLNLAEGKEVKIIWLTDRMITVQCAGWQEQSG